MRNYIRNNSKKILAVLGVILMVAFIIPPASKYGGNTTSRRLIGYVGDKKVYNTDVDRAKSQWDFLENAIMMSPERTRGQVMTLADAVRQDQSIFGPSFRILSEQLNAHPELFYLLQVEADRMGIIVTNSQAETLFKQAGLAVRLQ